MISTSLPADVDCQTKQGFCSSTLTGLGNYVVDSLQGYNADISHNVSKRLASPHLWELCAPKKTPVATCCLWIAFGVWITHSWRRHRLGFACSCWEDQRLFRLRTTSTMRKPGTHRLLIEAWVRLAQHMVLLEIHGVSIGTDIAHRPVLGWRPPLAGLLGIHWVCFFVVLKGQRQS